MDIDGCRRRCLASHRTADEQKYGSLAAALNTRWDEQQVTHRAAGAGVAHHRELPAVQQPPRVGLGVEDVGLRVHLRLVVVLDARVPPAAIVVVERVQAAEANVLSSTITCAKNPCTPELLG